MQKLLFGSNIVEITDCYKYRYQNRDEVLRFAAVNTTFDILFQLNNFSGTIYQTAEDGQTIVNQFEVVSQGVNIEYKVGNLYSVEVLLPNETTDRINELSAILDSLLFDVIPALTGGL